MTLYPYQSEDVAHLVKNPHHILANEAGLGKTLTTIRAMQTIFAGQPDARVLIVCSKSSMGVWKQEISTWQLEPWPVTVLPEGSAKRTLTLNQFERGWLLINREALRLFIDEFVSIGWYGIIIDEVHNFRSRPARADRKTGRSQASAALLRLNAKVQWAVSATLIDGDVRDIWPTLRWLFPKVYGSYWRFVLKHSIFEPDFYSVYGKYVGVKDLDALRCELSPLMRRRLKSEVASDLPPLRFQTVPIELSPQERKPYDAMNDEMLAEFENGNRLLASAKIAQLVRLQQIAACASVFDKSITSSKLAWTLEYISNCPATQSIVVASHFREPLLILQKQLPDAALLMGGVGNRAELIADFQSGKTRIMLMTIAAGGESISLSRSDTLIVLDKTWSSLEWVQLTNRLSRNDSLTRSHQSVLVISLVAEDTVDIAVERVLARKAEVNSEIILSTAIAQMRENRT